jgi:putative Mg2+ transporter-C (MgtC) family protein
MATLDILVRLALALMLGSAIGFERQWHQKMAGSRTNALVALGAAGFVIFSAMYPGADSPTRVAAQIVSGIGFLGAGVILREGVNVHGLNTAATLWCSAMVGTFAGGGFLMAAAAAATFVVITNLLLRPLVRRLNRRILTSSDAETYYTVEVTCKSAEEAHMRSLLLTTLQGAGLGAGSRARTSRTPRRSRSSPMRCQARATTLRSNRSSAGSASNRMSRPRLGRSTERYRKPESKRRPQSGSGHWAPQRPVPVCGPAP